MDRCNDVGCKSLCISPTFKGETYLLNSTRIIATRNNNDNNTNVMNMLRITKGIKPSSFFLNSPFSFSTMEKNNHFIPHISEVNIIKKTNNNKKRSKSSFEPVMRYVRITPQERREQLYAYHVARDILAQEENIYKKFPCSVDSHLISTDSKKILTNHSDGKHGPFFNNVSDRIGVDVDICGEKDIDLDCVKNQAMKECEVKDSIKGNLIEQLRYLVHMYEKHHNRTSPEQIKRNFLIPELLPLTETIDNNTQQQGQQQETDIATIITANMSTTAVTAGNVEGETELSHIHKEEEKDQCLNSTLFSMKWQTLLASCDSTCDLGSALQNVFRHDGGEYIEETHCNLLFTERERRTQSVRKHILKALKSLDMASRIHKGEQYDGGNSCSCKTNLQACSFEGKLDFCETILDTPVDATPHSHVKRLLDYLAKEPALQKCAEAAARLVTYVLMCSLPIELYEGDPEDYRFLRERARRMSSIFAPVVQHPQTLSSSTTTTTTTEMSTTRLERSSTPTPTPPQTQQTQQSRTTNVSSQPRFNTTKNVSDSKKNLSTCEYNLEKTDNYFLYQNSAALTQAVQSVALKKGIWLSSTMPIMNRPPLHACGLPLRAARDIAIGHRSLNMNGKENNLISKKGRMNITIENQIIHNSILNKQKIIKEETDELRPKTLAPLLIIAYGGYGVAPFSIGDEQLSFSRVLKKQGNIFDPLDYSERTEDNDKMFHAMNNFARPEPSLLPLHSVIQLICKSVRENRQISMNEIDPDVSPIVFELLMEIVQSYEACFQAILNMSFEPDPGRSIFINTYRETLLSWASIVICESAVGHAAERAGRGPANVSWIEGIISTTFTEEQLEEIALSGLVEKTFPNMTQWEYDEQLFLRTINTLRSVILEAIGRVKGELYFLISGVDCRNAVLEKYFERLQHEQAMEAAMKENAEEELQARLPGSGGVGDGDGDGEGEGEGGGGGEGKDGDLSNMTLCSIFPLQVDGSLSTPQLRSLEKAVPSSFHGGCYRRQDLSHTFVLEADEGFGSHIERSDTPLLFTRMSRQPECGSTIMPLPIKGEDLVTTRNSFSKRLQAKQPQRVKRGVSSDFPRLSSCISPVTRALQEGNLRMTSSPVSMCFLSGEKLKRQSTQDEKQGILRTTPLVPSRPMSTQGNRPFSRSHTSDIPEDLTVSSVRRDLVSLKFRGRQPTKTTLRSGQNVAASSSLLSTSALQTTAFDVTISSSPLPTSSSILPLTPENETSQTTKGVNTLALVVGPKQAAAVERMRRVCENTMQFYMHFQNALDGDDDMSRNIRRDIQWYATGSTSFFERRAVANIKRSRLVAAFDLHYISPITALGKCALWPSNRRNQDDINDQEQKQCLLKLRELHLGEAMVSWTL